MRLATSKEHGFVFAFSESPKTYFRWKDYAAATKESRLVAIGSFQDFLTAECDETVFAKAPGLKASLSSVGLADRDFLIPFRPTAFRDFYCFEEHVQNARKSRGLEMIPEWYQAPHFYYSNHLSFVGPNAGISYPKGSEEVDFEVEFACVVGKKLRDANEEQAREAILGYTILNDWTARDFQRFEMKVNMGPVKGKDFATSFGPVIVTKSDSALRRAQKGFAVDIELDVNGENLVKNTWEKISFSFEEMLVRASKNCTVYPGEVIASGTVGKGCLLELNVLNNTKRWLKVGDRVILRSRALQMELVNTIE